MRRSCADGYVGMQIIPRRDGYVGGIDHFGMVVDDVNVVLERMQKKHPQGQHGEASLDAPVRRL